MAIDGQISFPGIATPIYIRAAVRTNGFRPNKCLLVALPQTSSPSLTGTLTFGFNGLNVSWPNALCDQRLMQVSTGGQYVQWTIVDGRWRHWKKFAKKAFNVRLPDGTIDPDTEATLSEIATFLLTEMGTSGDVSALDASTEKPEVIIDNERCVLELEELLDRRGFVASYGFNDTYKIYRIGTGATLPNDGDVVNFSNSTNPPELPQTLRALCAHTLVQSKFKLIPVGLDIDGKVKKVDDLSYNPAGEGVAGGWDGKDLLSFNYIIDDEERELATMTVGKWYQIETQADGTHEISGGGVNYAPGEITIDDVLQYLPLNDHLAETADDLSGKKRYKPAFVEGTFYDDDDNPPKGQNSPPHSRIMRRYWTMNKELGIVMFKDVARKIKDDLLPPKDRKFTFAVLYLTCSYTVHDNDTHIKDRYVRDRSLSGTGMDQVPAEELERTLICEYDSNDITISSITDNEATVIAEADRLLDNAQASYSTGIGNTILYRGIRRYTTDGVNWQVVWKCAAPGMVPFSTFVAQNCEAHPLAPRAGDRRLKRQNDRSNLWNTSRGRRFRNAKKGKN